MLIPGESFSLERAQSYLRVPPSVLQLAKQGFPSVATFSTVVSAFDLYFSNASPASINVAAGTSGGLKSLTNVVGINTSAPLVIPIPEYNTLTVGPVTVADAVGDVMSLSVGNATAAVQLLDAEGNKLYGFDVTCAPYAALELIGVTIAETLPLNYSLGQIEPSTPSS